MAAWATTWPHGSIGSRRSRPSGALKARYADVCDTGYDAGAHAFRSSRDAVWDGGQRFGRYEGIDAIARFFARCRARSPGRCTTWSRRSSTSPTTASPQRGAGTSRSRARSSPRAARRRSAHRHVRRPLPQGAGRVEVLGGARSTARRSARSTRAGPGGRSGTSSAVVERPAATSCTSCLAGEAGFSIDREDEAEFAALADAIFGVRPARVAGARPHRLRSTPSATRAAPPSRARIPRTRSSASATSRHRAPTASCRPGRRGQGLGRDRRRTAHLRLARPRRGSSRRPTASSPIASCAPDGDGRGDHEHGRPRLLGRRRLELVRADAEPVGSRPERQAARRAARPPRCSTTPSTSAHRRRPGRLDPRAGVLVRRRRAEADTRARPVRRASPASTRPSTTAGRWRGRRPTSPRCSRRSPARTRPTRGSGTSPSTTTSRAVAEAPESLAGVASASSRRRFAERSASTRPTADAVEGAVERLAGARSEPSPPLASRASAGGRDRLRRLRRGYERPDGERRQRLLAGPAATGRSFPGTRHRAPQSTPRSSPRR